MKKIIFLALAMIAFSGCDKANSAECPDLRTQEFSDGSVVRLYIRARDDISIHNIIINRGNCMYAGPKTLFENIDLKFGEERSIWLSSCKPLEVVLETNLGQCEYKF